MNAKENAQMLDPNRFKIAKNMVAVPGGPENNNPMNVTDIASPPITAPSIYGDYQQNYVQMGTGLVDPSGVPHSQLPHNNPRGTGYNSMEPYNMQQQPSPDFEEMLEGGRLTYEGKQRGLHTEPFLGISGMPATPAPGGVMPTPQQTQGTVPLVGNSTQAMPPAGGMNTKSGKRG